MPRRSRPSGRPSTTSPRTNNATSHLEGLRGLIDALPPERAARAFVHPSSVGSRDASYERLEFLGDSVLGFAIVSRLFEQYPELHEGQLSRVRADVVSRRACAVVARDLELGARLETEKASSETLRTSSKVLAAVFEAVLGVLFLEYGAEAIRGAVADAFQPAIEESLAEGPDPKTRLQELAASRGQTVVYETVHTEGPAHDRVFTIAVLVDDEPCGTGVGRSKKDAEQAAAREALGTF
jgi:ribonuclease III